MDRSLDFFISTFDALPLEAEQSFAQNSNYPTTQFPQTTTTTYYNAVGTKINEDPPKTETVKGRASLFNPAVYINYRGDNSSNTYKPLTSDGATESDISLASIISWSKNYPAMSINALDLAYIRNIGVMPANRMIVLRRFRGPAPDDLFGPKTKNMRPMSTLVGFIDPDDEKSFEISFNEKWEPSVKEGLVDVINKIIGFSNKSALLPTFEGASNLEQSIFVKLGNYLGITKKAENPKGNPNVIHEAAIRTTEYEGLSCKFSISFTTEYEAAYIKGLDPAEAMADIIGNVVNMGTSPSEFIVTGKFGGQVQKIADALRNGKFTDLVADIFNIFTAAVGNLANLVVDSIKKGASAIATAATDKNARDKLIADKVSQAKTAVNDFLAGINDLIAINVRRYEWPLKGAIAAMTGAHTAPWHICIGNPRAPFISVGNLIIEDCKIEYGNKMLYNDTPTRLKVTYKLGPGRNMGAQEITGLFNVSKGRIYVPISKTRRKVVIKSNKDK